MKKPATVRLLPILPTGPLASVRAALREAPNAHQVGRLALDMAAIYAGYYHETPGGVLLPWIGYLAQDEASGEVVGACAFRLNRSRDGTPEIPYFTFPAYEGRGYARAMATELVAIARQHGAPRIRSYTARLDGAPARIVSGLGFELVGPYVHPEAGPTYVWETPAAGTAGATAGGSRPRPGAGPPAGHPGTAAPSPPGASPGA